MCKRILGLGSGRVGELTRVSCFKTNPLDCTLLARWDEGYKDPWLVVTDLEATKADIQWYSLRCWIECSYRDLKSDGW